jgi:hypothetical protein
MGAGGGFRGRFQLGRHALREAGARCTKSVDFVDLETGYPHRAFARLHRRATFTTH